MAIKKNKQTETVIQSEQRLNNWFFKKPVRFALLTLGIIIGILLFFFIANQLFIGTDSLMLRLPIFITVAAGIVFSVTQLIKWLPKDPLDRYSFISIDNGLTIIYYIFILLSTVLFVKNYSSIFYLSMSLNNGSLVLFFLTMILGSFLYLYVMGLMITNIYAVYLRAVYIGIPKWKAILAMPFATTLIWLPGYLLSEDKKDKKVIEIKSKLFSGLTKLIMKKSINSILVFLLTILFCYLFLGIFSAVITLLFGLIFATWISFIGVKKFNKSIGDNYATFAAVLNIAFIISFILLFALPINKLPNNITSTQIQEAVTQTIN